MNNSNTVVNKRIVFLKDDAGWYADMEGTRAQNAMVSGADKMIEALSGGRSHGSATRPTASSTATIPETSMSTQSTTSKENKQ